MSEETTTTRRDSYNDTAINRIEKLSGAVRRHRIELDQTKDKLAEAERQLKAITKERDDLAVKADHSMLAKANDALRLEIRGYKTREAFDAAGLVAGADPKMMTDLFTLAKIPINGDEPNAEAIAAFWSEAATSKPWGFLKPADPNAPQPPKPGAGTGQGGNASGPSSFTMQDNDPRISDVRYQMNNAAAIQAAALDRLARGELR
jgi:hypothetical protein